MEQWLGEVRQRWSKYWKLYSILFVLAILFVVGGVIAGHSGEDDSNAAYPQTNEAAPSEGNESQQRSSPGNSVTDVAREVAREVCSTATQSQMAREFGVSDELTSVVEAYGEGSTEPARAASEQGCLEGLSE